MAQHLSIITGASRGLGAALAAQLLAKGHRLLTMSRRAPALQPSADSAVEHWPVDLAEPLPVAARLQAWLQGLPRDSLASVCLVHNAALLNAPGPLQACSDQDLSAALRVGLEAPLLLSAAFLRGTADWSCRRRLLFISSGLGRRAMAGSAGYCAAKAGMDHLARALALEQAGQPNPVQVVSLAPGVIDTDMQVQLRQADPAVFAEQARFAALQSGGLLDTPQEAAARVLAYLARPDFGREPVGDVRG